LFQQSKEGNPALFGFSCFSGFALTSCTGDEVIEPLPKDEAYRLDKPAGFPEITFDITGNPVTVNG
jgi:cytochrome c peroxidase